MKNKVRRISLWLIIFLWKEKQNKASLILIKIVTLEYFFIILGSLAKVSQLEWLITFTNKTPSLSVKLVIDLIVVQDSF